MRTTSRHLLCAAATAALAAPVLAQVSTPQSLPPIADPATYAGFVPPSGNPAPTPSPSVPPPPAPPPVTAPFARHIISQNLRGAYIVLAADMNKDGKADLIGLGQREDYLIWYENPYWTPHEIRTPVPLPQMVNMDAADIDGDGIPEIAVTFAFNMNPALSVGNIAILHSNANGDPLAPWTMKIVDQVPAPHRVRFADLDGNGKLALLVAPILNPKSQPVPSNDPDHLPTALYAYHAPDWKRELVTQENIGPVHALRPFDWDGDGRQDVVTAGQSGTFGHSYKDGKWKRFLIAPGNPAPWPDSGASDIGFGKIAGKQFFAAIEPLHGNLVVVYIQDAQGKYHRNVIDNDLKRGHAITMVDVDGDGMSEIVAGGGASSSNTYLYKATDATGQTWKRMLMDTSLAAADCVTADLKGDKKNRDVICLSGQAPNNMTWYEYTGK